MSIKSFFEYPLIRFLSHITFGKMKRHYVEKKEKYKFKQNFEFYRLYKEEVERNKLANLDDINLKKLNIGKCMALSIAFDGKLRLSPEDKGKRIIKCYNIYVNSINYVGYETNDKNIYFIASQYSSYWGYFDNKFNFYPFSNPDVTFGLPLYPLEVNNRLKKLKKKISIFSVLKIYRKKILLFSTWNLGHHIWNEQPGIDTLIKFNLLKNFSYLYYFIDYFDMSLFLNTKNIKSKYIKSKNFCTHDLIIYFTEYVFLNNTSDRLLAYCKSMTESIVQKNEIIIIITIRQNRRIWREELIGIPKIINNISEKYENISFYIDGFSKPSREGDGFKTENNIVEDYSKYEIIKENLSLKGRNNTRSIIGQTCIEKINTFDKASFLVMPFGSPEHYNWIVKKDIILYGPKEARQLSTVLNSHIIIPDINIDSYKIKQQHITNEINGDYSMDWRILYDAMCDKINKLKQSV